MEYSDFSTRQLLALSWWKMDGLRDKDGIICSGAIRSGKTTCETVGFIIWALETFDRQNFAICGYSVTSAERNIVNNLADWLPTEYTITITGHRVIIEKDGRSGVFYIFGGHDERSFKSAQGLTLAGAFLDEVALMPQSFVDQVVFRCSVPGSKLWFSCNPASPEHYFYKEWIQKASQKNLLYLHFTMKDNLALSDKIKKRYEDYYRGSGAPYRRYILGEWVQADGLVYRCFDAARHVVQTKERPAADRGRYEYYVSCDYGTHNPTSLGLWELDPSSGTATRIKEYYHSGRDSGQEKTPQEYLQELDRLADGYNVRAVVIDPAAAEFITTVRRSGRYSVRKAKNAVLPGIALTSAALKGGFLFVSDRCRDCIREFGLYMWDDKAVARDTVIKEHDHSMDDTRYFVSTILARYSPPFRAYADGLGLRATEEEKERTPHR